jgi:hypothetical protein
MKVGQGTRLDRILTGEPLKQVLLQGKQEQLLTRPVPQQIKPEQLQDKPIIRALQDKVLIPFLRLQ